ncbi:MAG: tRNA (5-methylaminomethyl-2-thiouridine)(34)-methyltransferase MnmD [Bacteroidales bacterium]|jgi:tRNA U34 5-methylaminomethyl-2-thiouridine-forming methyltransferase MnmC|nr:tRNA (5-methylaminomethyl-2-thiouridine)(34)-methyltransferase MnmD [Bacteroidales bacterium]
MVRQLSVITTEDGSKTIYSGQFGEHYHSTYGAVNESNHVFIEAGYLFTEKNPVSVLEIGFGTGLNAFLTLQQAEKLNRPTYYEAIELYPVEGSIMKNISTDETFLQLHASEWDQAIKITDHFILNKRKGDLTDIAFSNNFDVIYFDAFSPEVQPEMWTTDIFSKLYSITHSKGVLTTYCAKGAVRRNLQSIGYAVERLPGPKGKREILRGRK